MKSAIFQDRQPLQTRATPKHGLKRRPQTQSPQIGPSSGPKFSSWSLEDLISNYTVNGSLPTPLSPTLPPRFESKKFEPEDNDQDGDDSNDSELDSIPVSLLSPIPTLGTKAEQPVLKAPKARSVPAQGKSSFVNSKNQVRIINKLSDIERPRLLVRINYKSQTYKLKSKLNAEETHSPSKVFDASKKEHVNKSSKELEFKPRASWAGTIRDLQSQCERISSKDFFFSVVLEFDLIICSVIACEPEERQKLLGKPSVAERNWSYVHSSVPQFVSRIEKYLKLNSVSDKMKSMLSFLVAILAIIRALLLKRINAYIEVRIKGEGQENIQRISDLRKQIVDNYHKIEDNFAQSQSFFSLSPPPATVFPNSWHHRVSSIPRPTSITLSPSADRYFLPLGSYSDLREAVAYLHNCVREFSEIFASELNGGARYSLQSGQKRSS